MTVTLTATDNVGGSGVAATYYGLTNPLCAPASPQGCSVYTGPFTIPSESGAIVLFFSVDAAGNTESLNTVLVSIDQTDPYAAPTISGTEGDNGWYTSAVTVTWNWTDDLSDLDTTRCPATSSSNSDGEASISATCYDQAGNDYEASVPVKIDQTPPAGNPTISGTLGDNGWYVGQVTVTWNWADATSGTNSCPPVTNALAEGQYTITANCSDMAGNTATGSVPIKIDQTPPAFAPTTNGTEGDNFWYTSPVTVTWNWTDPTSGINPTTCPTTTLVTTDGEQEVMEACRDLAGNVAAGRSVVRIDQTPPTVTYSGNAGSYGVDDQIEITCTASDATSGIASTTCQNITGPAASFELGTHTFSATATDNAGHTSSATTTFTIGLDYDSLAALTCQMVNQQTWCSTLSYYLASAEWAEGRHVGTLQQHYLNLYATMVTSLRNRGLSAQDAQTLLNLVQILQPPVTRGR
ncbi:MAG: Ig-like domain-containing protein [Thermomicrobiales bacterium]|nr:Ig-like domain-containing protein [Thermomicrobiales bacterium]